MLHLCAAAAQAERKTTASLCFSFTTTAAQAHLRAPPPSLAACCLSRSLNSVALLFTVCFHFQELVLDNLVCAEQSSSNSPDSTSI
ncbi:hypothetical protein AHAS_Ahas18G0055100 [Arachis hypogaea]